MIAGLEKKGWAISGGFRYSVYNHKVHLIILSWKTLEFLVLFSRGGGGKKGNVDIFNYINKNYHLVIMCEYWYLMRAYMEKMKIGEQQLIEVSFPQYILHYLMQCNTDVIRSSFIHTAYNCLATYLLYTCCSLVVNILVGNQLQYSWGVAFLWIYCEKRSFFLSIQSFLTFYAESGLVAC